MTIKRPRKPRGGGNGRGGRGSQTTKIISEKGEMTEEKRAFQPNKSLLGKETQNLPGGLSRNFFKGSGGRGWVNENEDTKSTRIIKKRTGKKEGVKSKGIGHIRAKEEGHVKEEELTPVQTSWKEGVGQGRGSEDRWVSQKL